MKMMHLLIMMAALSSAEMVLLAAEQSADSPAKLAETVTNAPSNREQAPYRNTNVALPQENHATFNGDTNELRLNFRGAPLEMVLNYFSEAAGFIVNVKPGATVRGKNVEAWSNQPLSRDEALNLLDTVLNQNSLAAIRNGRT